MVSSFLKRKLDNELEGTSFSISRPFGDTAVHFRKRCFIRVVLPDTKKS